MDDATRSGRRCDMIPPMARWLPLLTLCACGPSLPDYERGVDLLVEELELATGFAASDAKAAISRARIETSEHLIVNGERIGGYLDGDRVHIRWSPNTCIADTGLQHEFTHLIICSFDADCDKDHKMREWWWALAAAQQRWLQEICPEVLDEWKDRAR